MKYCTLAFFIPKRKMEVGQCKGDSRFVPYSLSHGLRLLRKIFSPFSHTLLFRLSQKICEKICCHFSWICCLISQLSLCPQQKKKLRRLDDSKRISSTRNSQNEMIISYKPHKHINVMDGTKSCF